MPSGIETQKGICTLPANYVNTKFMPTSYENSSCKLNLLVTDANGCEIKRAPVSGKSDMETNIENSENDKIVIYPNPTTGSFTISNINNAVIYLYSSLGNLIKVFEHVSNSETVNAGDLPNGLYFLKIIENNAITHKKLILTK